MRVFDLALKDISQVLRDKRSLLFLLAMPVVFTLFMGFAYKGSTATPADPRLAVGWINLDSGPVSASLKTLLEATPEIRLVELASADRATLEEQVQSGALAAGWIVPPGFGQKALAGQPVQAALVADELSTAGQSALQLGRVPLSRLMSAAEAARLSTAALEAARPFASASLRQQELEAAFQEAVNGWQAAGSQGLSVAVEKATGQPPAGPQFGGNPYNQSSPGMLVMFAVFGLINTATILVTERKTRTLQRMLTTSLARRQIILGHLLAMFAISLVGQLLLILFGQLALGVDYFRQPLAVLLVAMALALWISSLGLLIGVLAPGEERVTLFAMIAMFIFTALGGAWFPLETSGPVFAAIGHLSPAAWAMDGFQNILLRGQGLESVLLPVGVLLAYAAAFFTLAVWRFKSE